MEMADDSPLEIDSVEEQKYTQDKLREALGDELFSEVDKALTLNLGGRLDHVIPDDDHPRSIAALVRFVQVTQSRFLFGNVSPIFTKACQIHKSKPQRQSAHPEPAQHAGS
jgi:hypothetical protein